MERRRQPMNRKDVLFDSPYGIVKIWNPERQFPASAGGGVVSPMPVIIKAVIVESRVKGWSPDDVVLVRSFELRLRGFHMKDAVETISDKGDGSVAILHDLFQEANKAERDELLSRYIHKLRDRKMDKEAALLRTRQIALICSPPISDTRAWGLFREVWDAVEPEDAPVPRMKDLLYIAQKEIAELKSERARLRTTLQAAVMKLDALKGK
jgi:hypothetical protein